MNELNGLSEEKVVGSADPLINIDWKDNKVWIALMIMILCFGGIVTLLTYRQGYVDGWNEATDLRREELFPNAKFPETENASYLPDFNEIFKSPKEQPEK